jgi:hypothetical protein
MRGNWAGRLRRWASALKVELALVLLAIVALGPIVSEETAQPASRMALTAALAEHGTVDVGRYPLGVDHATYEGHDRSDKAPGQPVLAVPAYVVGRLFGAESPEYGRFEGNLGVWWVTFWSSIVPFALLLVLMYRTARRCAPQAALAATLAIGFATILLPHAASLYGHVLAACLGFAAFFVAERDNASSARLVAAGALAGLAVAVEYHAIIVAAVVFVALARRERARGLWMLLGAVPSVLLIAVYQARAFGSPLHTPYAYYAGTLNGTSEGGYTLPGFHNLNMIFVGTRGLLIVSPIVLVAIVGAFVVSRGSDAAPKRLAIVALVISGGYLLLSAGWSGTPLLEEPGPRYMIPALPFLVVPLAAVWSRWRRVAVLASAVGAVLMITATLTFLLIQVGHTSLTYFRYVRVHHFSPNIWFMAFGKVGVAFYVLSVAVCLVLLREAARPASMPAATKTPAVPVTSLTSAGPGR